MEKEKRWDIKQMFSWVKENKCLLCGDRRGKTDSGLCDNCRDVSESNRQNQIKTLKKDVPGFIPSWLKEMQIPAYCEVSSMDNLTLLSPEEKEDIQACMAYENLFLQGIPGAGKTWVSVTIFREWIKQEALLNVERNAMITIPSGMFINIPEFMASLRRMKAERQNPWKVIDNIKDRKILVLDDLGVEVGSRDFTMDILYAIINHRYTNKDSGGFRMIITSDRSIQEISDELHDRLASRLYEICRVLTFPERNLRILKKEEEVKGD